MDIVCIGIGVICFAFLVALVVRVVKENKKNQKLRPNAQPDRAGEIRGDNTAR